MRKTKMKIIKNDLWPKSFEYIFAESDDEDDFVVFQDKDKDLEIYLNLDDIESLNQLVNEAKNLKTSRTYFKE